MSASGASPARTPSSGALSIGRLLSPPLGETKTIVFEFDLPTVRNLKDETMTAVSTVLGAQSPIVFHYAGLCYTPTIFEIFGYLDTHESYGRWIPQLRSRFAAHRWEFPIVECYVNPDPKQIQGYFLVCYPYNGAVALHIAVVQMPGVLNTTALAKNLVFATSFFKRMAKKIATGAGIGTAAGLSLDAACGFATLGAGAAVGTAVGALAVRHKLKKEQERCFHGDEVISQDAKDHLEFELGSEIYSRTTNEFHYGPLFECFLLHMLRFRLSFEVENNKFRLFSLREAGFLPLALVSRFPPALRDVYSWTHQPVATVFDKATTREFFTDHVQNYLWPCQWFGDVSPPSRAEKKEDKRSFFIVLKGGLLFLWSERAEKLATLPPPSQVLMLKKDCARSTEGRKQSKTKFSITVTGNKSKRRTDTVILGLSDKTEALVLLAALRDAHGYVSS